MAYYLIRFYSGSGDRPPEQLIREVVDHELRPKLQAGGGLTRYITFIADDGRVGSASILSGQGSRAKGFANRPRVGERDGRNAGISAFGNLRRRDRCDHRR